MSEDDDDFGAQGIYVERNDRVYAQVEGRARQIRDTATTCAKCGGPMMRWPGRNVHFSCDPELPMAGKACTCAPGCSDVRWGDGPSSCDPDCVPCRNMRGQPLRKRGRS